MKQSHATDRLCSRRCLSHLWPPKRSFYVHSWCILNHKHFVWEKPFFSFFFWGGVTQKLAFWLALRVWMLCWSNFRMAGQAWLLWRAAQWWRMELSVYAQQWNKTSALLQCSDSDRRLTHSTQDRKFNFYTYLVLDSIKTKTESQSQLGNSVCELSRFLCPLLLE